MPGIRISSDGPELTPLACWACFTSKSRCDKQFPCTRCTDKNTPCMTKHRRRRGQLAVDNAFADLTNEGGPSGYRSRTIAPNTFGTASSSAQMGTNRTFDLRVEAIEDDLFSYLQQLEWNNLNAADFSGLYTTTENVQQPDELESIVLETETTRNYVHVRGLQPMPSCISRVVEESIAESHQTQCEHCSVKDPGLDPARQDQYLIDWIADIHNQLQQMYLLAPLSSEWNPEPASMDSNDYHSSPLSIDGFGMAESGSIHDRNWFEMDLACFHEQMGGGELQDHQMNSVGSQFDDMEIEIDRDDDELEHFMTEDQDRSRSLMDCCTR